MRLLPLHAVDHTPPLRRICVIAGSLFLYLFLPLAALSKLPCRGRATFSLCAAAHRLLLDILHMAAAEGLTLGRGTERNPVYVLLEQ